VVANLRDLNTAAVDRVNQAFAGFDCQNLAIDGG
jgi:hypothetical protein